ncbi:hypothetical protein D8M04_17380 [Oceanobacillus piezotolerans]|uniref:Nucleotidase n=1 Tax=Oceanobacillus piezotolerans TaxID=2448030 RepID=A0A498D2T5_9BACI|nr:HAD hydrolase-like protein [Oceanobacillus piezotolerans]RLL41296.1 hypothetical protein D8M04_17380 [Oceanobacillus piezotolerans]
MRFGFDIDDTLINLREHAFHIYNKKLNKQVSLEQFKLIDRVEIHEPFGLTDKEGNDMWNRSLEEIYFTNCPPYPDAVETLQELAKADHEIYYITARPKEHGERTKKWMKNLGFPIDDARFYYGMKDNEKIHTIKTLHLDFYIDDKPAVLQTLEQEPITLFMMDQPYNQSITHHHRLTNWKDFMNLIENHA